MKRVHYLTRDWAGHIVLPITSLIYCVVYPFVWPVAAAWNPVRR